MNNRIIRVGRRTDPFARVCKSMLDDSRLSWRAKGMLTYLMGKPDDWKLRVTDLVNRGTDGKHSIRAALKELRAFGYASLVQIRDKGKVAEWVWKVSDSCVFSPDSDFQEVGFQEVEN